MKSKLSEKWSFMRAAGAILGILSLVIAVKNADVALGFIGLFLLARNIFYPSACCSSGCTKDSCIEERKI